MRPQDLLFDLLDFDTNFLTVRRVEHETLERGPGLEGANFALLARGTESVDETAEDVAAINVTLEWLLNHGDLVKGANADLAEYFVDLFERL